MRARGLITVLIVPLLGLAVTPAVSAATDTAGDPAGVRVTGDVAAPADYSGAQLAAMPQVTVRDRRGGDSGGSGGSTVTGVDLDALVTAAAPVLPAGAKNGQLRVLVTVSGTSGSRTIALGETDPGFGAHPALLALAQDGRPVPDGSWLAVPGDHGYARTVVHVTQVDVDVVTTAVPVPAPGDVVVRTAAGDTTLTAAQLAALPQQTRTVTFLAGPAPQTHVETGPSLLAVLRAAHVRRTTTTGVAAVGSDGYTAAVTPAEATSGRRPLLLSLDEDGLPPAQPRLIAAGDLRGGRDVSGVVALDVVVEPAR